MRSKAVSDSPFRERLSGILVHPTSFPSPYGIGDLGDGARRFLDFLKKGGQHLWQVLPLGPTGFGNSPYQSYSSFAGQPLIISPDEIKKDGLLSDRDLQDIPQWENVLRVDFDAVKAYKDKIFLQAYANFVLATEGGESIEYGHVAPLKVYRETAETDASENVKETSAEAETPADNKADSGSTEKEAEKTAAPKEPEYTLKPVDPITVSASIDINEDTRKKLTAIKKEYEAFVKANPWAENYALFMALKDYHHGCAWYDWEQETRMPDKTARKKWAEKLSTEVDFYRFQQFLFYRQWNAIKEYAHDRDIEIIGDIPIFVSADSADVWADPELFQLDTTGHPLRVSGVPPDYFSATGQLWGNPLYDWKKHKATGYAWWIARVKAQLSMTDYLRIDHFRGFEAFWSVPATEKTAINGEWVKGPGADLFNAIKKALGDDLPIIAEDLGVITPEVEALRDQFEFPGMKVLQFAFDDTGENAFLPHHYDYNCVVYSGTHDNDTTWGWYKKASEASRDKVRRYMSCDGNSVSWDFIRTAWMSVAHMAIVPLQDVMRMDSDARMNTPGVAEGNWIWRYSDDQLKNEDAENLHSLTELYGRL